jgi:hypothetical protein
MGSAVCTYICICAYMHAYIHMSHSQQSYMHACTPADKHTLTRASIHSCYVFRSSRRTCETRTHASALYIYVCMYVCVYVYVCMYVCMCVCMYVYTYNVCLQSMLLYREVIYNVCVCMYICIYIYIYMYVYMCMYVYICMYVCMYTHTMFVYKS